MTPERAERIARAVEAGVERWPRVSKFAAAAEAPAPPTPSVADVVQPMPRRTLAHTSGVPVS